MADDREHEWFRTRILPLALGLLEEDQQILLTEHLERCEECRALGEACAVDPDDPDLGHLPAAWLARWPDTLAQIRGLERTAARTHLDDCTSCREALQILGYQPAVPLDADLEATPDAVESSDRSPSAGSRPTIVRRGAAAPQSGVRSWWRSATGIWAGTATLAAAVLAGIAIIPAPTLETSAPALVRPTVTRGGTQESSLLVVAPDDRSAILALPLPENVPDGEGRIVWILDPDDEPVARTRVQPGHFEASVVTILWAFDDTPRPGLYRVAYGPDVPDSAIPGTDARWMSFQVLRQDP